MRLCPTVEGSPSPLITHRIPADVCQARQGTNFHKCHRCIYRGKPVDWQPADAADLTIETNGVAAGRNGAARQSRGPAPTRRPAPRRVAEAEA